MSLANTAIGITFFVAIEVLLLATSVNAGAEIKNHINNVFYQPQHIQNMGCENPQVVLNELFNRNGSQEESTRCF